MPEKLYLVKVRAGNYEPKGFDQFESKEEALEYVEICRFHGWQVTMYEACRMDC